MNSTGADSHAPGSAGVGSPEEAPRRLGQYQIVRPLGRGGMGMVFEAYHLLLRQRAAVKVMHPTFGRDPRFVARFQREMAALGQIPAHPNLVRAQYAGEEQGVLYLAMDFVEGEDLGHLLRRGPLASADACEVVRQAALGLEAVHQAGLVHRDLKPSNLILTRDGMVKILDLGLARLREPEPSQEELTPTNAQLGTFDYQAPEQSDDPRRVDIRADVYSLGCTLYALLTGGPPFAGHGSPAKKIYAHAHLDFPTLGPAAAIGLGAVLARMTAKQPEGRYNTPRETAEARAPFAGASHLSGLFDGAPAASGPAFHEAPTQDRRHSPTPETTVSPLPSAGKPTQPARPARRFPTLPVFGALVLIAFAAAVLVRVFPFGGTQGQAPPPNVAGPSGGEGEPAPPADLFLAAGDAPRPLDALAPFDIHDLLDRAPAQAYWDPAGGAALRAYEPARKQLVVQSPQQALFQLGTITQPSFTFQVQILQPNWSPGAGVFLGYREADAPRALAFQYLLFSERTTVAGKPICVLNRGRCRITDLAGRKSFDWRDEAGEDVETPRGAAWLIVEVKDRGLDLVRVNGVELKKLAVPSVNAVFTEADYRGGLGLLCSANSSVFRQATLTLSPGR